MLMVNGDKLWVIGAYDECLFMTACLKKTR